MKRCWPIQGHEIAQAMEDIGACESLLNCIDCDGNESLLSTYNACSVSPAEIINTNVLRK